MRAFFLGLVAVGAALVGMGSCALDQSGTSDNFVGPGASSGTSGSGAGNPGTPCQDRSECPADGPCVVYDCLEGFCTPTFAPEGSEVAGSVQGDCKRVLCSATGAPTEQVDDADTPPDQDCKVGGCQQGAPVLTPKENGSPCGANGDLECAAGVCVGCSDASDCIAGVCEDPVCNGMNRCSTTPKGAGVEVSDASSSDCMHDVCDGAGNVMTAADTNDNPSDGEDCTTDACDGTVPTHLPASNGVACNSGGGDYCYGGVCSECGLPANCAAQDCKVATCNGGTCGLMDAPNETGCGSGQFCLGGVCSQCAVSANCPSPPPNQCITAFTCTAQGICAPVLAADGASCGGGNHCLAGVCVQCLTTPDCSAPSPCHTVACVNNACVEGQAGNGTSCGQNRVCCIGTCCGMNETCSMGMCQP